jgi:hypothetical protein
VTGHAAPASHPVASSASTAIGSTLRRRLSNTFQRDSAEIGLAIRAPRPGTWGHSHAMICQSPRIQRCRRAVSAAWLDGKSSTSMTSLTRPERA